MRVIFYAEPKNPDAELKSVPDSESLGAEWVTLEEFKNKDNIRGDELLEFGSYIENGGHIMPLSMLNEGYKQRIDEK